MSTNISRLFPWNADFWTATRVIQALEPLVSVERRAKLQAVIAQRISNVTLLLDAPYYAHNVAAVTRSCEALGVQDLHVVQGNADLAELPRISRGTERWLDLHTHTCAVNALSLLNQHGFVPVMADAGGEMAPDDLRQISRLVLVLGNEHAGIRKELIPLIQHSVRIPMRGFAESLNVSVSAALLLYEATRHRSGDLTDTEQEALYARGLYYTVRNPEAVLEHLQKA